MWVVVCVMNDVVVDRLCLKDWCFISSRFVGVDCSLKVLFEYIAKCVLCVVVEWSEIVDGKNVMSTVGRVGAIQEASFHRLTNLVRRNHQKNAIVVVQQACEQ